MKVEFLSSFEKDLRKIKDRSLLKKIEQLIVEIEDSQILNTIRHLEKIKGTVHNYYRIKLGQYRIGIEFVNGKVIFYRVLHRKDIYKYFP